MTIHPKVYWPAVVGMICIAGSWALEQVWHVEIPAYVMAAVQSGLMGLAGYSAPQNGDKPDV